MVNKTDTNITHLERRRADKHKPKGWWLQKTCAKKKQRPKTLPASHMRAQRTVARRLAQPCLVRFVHVQSPAQQSSGATDVLKTTPVSINVDELKTTLAQPQPQVRVYPPWTPEVRIFFSSLSLSLSLSLFRSFSFSLSLYSISISYVYLYLLCLSLSLISISISLA